MTQRLKMFVAIAILVSLVASLAIFDNGSRPVSFQGWIEADMLFIGPDEAGRLHLLTVKEGDKVAAGAPLFQVEQKVYDADWRAARAAVDEASARLARAEAKQQRPEEIAVLRAAESRAAAALALSQSEFARVRQLVAKGVSPKSRLDQAKAAFERDQASLEEVRRQIKVAELASRSEDVEAARQAVRQAEARLAAAETRRLQRSVAAPQGGLVQEIYFRPGEVVGAGRPVLALLPPGNMKLRFFVPEALLPRVSTGLRVTISCDGCTKRYSARISFISREAEFTPPVIYSLEERAKLVFRVEARPDEPEALRVGQPVTVDLTAAPAKPGDAHAHH
ncbi:MAG: HlyD family secretion protein [Hyphomicrobiaceae bacterium]